MSRREEIVNQIKQLNHELQGLEKHKGIKSPDEYLGKFFKCRRFKDDIDDGYPDSDRDLGTGWWKYLKVTGAHISGYVSCFSFQTTVEGEIRILRGELVVTQWLDLIEIDRNEFRVEWDKLLVSTNLIQY